MRVECNFFGPLREAVGTKTVEYELPSGSTIADLIAVICETNEDLAGSPFEKGENITITCNGTNVRQLEGVETELTDGAVLRFAPPVVGG